MRMDWQRIALKIQLKPMRNARCVGIILNVITIPSIVAIRIGARQMKIKLTFLPLYYYGWIIQPILCSGRIICCVYPDMDTSKQNVLEFDRVEQAIEWVRGALSG